MTPAYHELPGEQRYGAEGMAGDLAEDKVSSVLSAMDRPVVRFGVSRVDTQRAQHTTWSPLIRYAPDFLGWARFIECQGTNGDTVLFKEPKLESLIVWNTVMPVWFGLYNMKDDTVIFADLPSVLWACKHPQTQNIILDAGTKGEKVAYEVPLSLLQEIRFNNAFEADRIEKGKPKRAKQTKGYNT
jgi:hypothetical protein